MRWQSVAYALALTVALAATDGHAQSSNVRLIKPSDADPGIHAFDAANVVIAPPAPTAPLAVFLPGTGGRPLNAPALLKVIAEQGYAVICLEYEDDPAVIEVCPPDPDPGCSASFRQMRLHGTGTSKAVANTPAASIIGRLTALLVKLDHDHPAEGWGGYLKGGGPDWSRIAISGLSQGAGMAAYLAKETMVDRVVLFSSPWDFTNPGRKLAPWISKPSATPPQRWFAAYNAREQTADLLKASYGLLNIPPDHIRVFSLALPTGVKATGPNPFHPIGIEDTRYSPEWRFLYGDRH